MSPNCLSSFLSLFGFHLSPIFGLCSSECATLSSANVMKSLLSSTVGTFSIWRPLSQTHPQLCHLHLCFHLVWLLGPAFTFFYFCIWPPCRPRPCTDVFQCRQHRIRLRFTSPFHCTPHAFGNRLRQEREASPFFQILLAAASVRRVWCRVGSEASLGQAVD